MEKNEILKQLKALATLYKKMVLLKEAEEEKEGDKYSDIENEYSRIWNKGAKAIYKSCAEDIEKILKGEKIV